MYYELYPIYNGSFSVTFSADYDYFKDIKNIPSYVFLLISEDGEKILVDTGFATNYIPGFGSTYSRQPEDELPNALLKHNVYPDEIKTIIQTHLHWDHTGGMDLFPQAAFYVQTLELLGLLEVVTFEESSFNPNHWLPCLDRFTLIDGHYELRPGLNLLCSGKHSKGHQVVEVQTKSGIVILGGDSPFVYGNWWEMIPQKIWQQYLANADSKFFWHPEVKNAIQAKLNAAGKSELINPQIIGFPNIKGRGDIFLASHDPRLRKITSL